MNASESKDLRELLTDALDGGHSHIRFEAVVKDFPPEWHDTKPAGAPHSAWELLEHLRIAQWDILEFSRNPNHKSPDWPGGYWPNSAALASPDAWEQSIAQFRSDGQAFSELLQKSPDLNKPFARGEGQTLLREALVLANHNSYHLGQLEYLKKMLAEQS